MIVSLYLLVYALGQRQLRQDERSCRSNYSRSTQEANFYSTGSSCSFESPTTANFAFSQKSLSKILFNLLTHMRNAR